MPGRPEAETVAGAAPSPREPGAAGPPAEDDAAGLLEGLAHVPASTFGTSVDRSIAAAPAVQQRQKAELEASFPEIPAPTGLPARAHRAVPAPTTLPRGETPEMAAGGSRPPQAAGLNRAVEFGPLPPIGATPPLEEPPGDAEGSWWEWLIGRIRELLSGISTTDPGMSTSAGPRPSVDASGEADPGRAPAYEAISQQTVACHRRAVDRAVSADFGENEIYPMAKGRTVRLAYKPAHPKTLPGTAGALPGLPPDLRASFDRQAAPLISAKVDTSVANYRESRASYETQSQEAREEAQLQLEEATATARAEQRAIQVKTRSEVDGARQQWAAENEQIENRFVSTASAKRSEVGAQIDSAIKTGDEAAARALSEAESRAEAEHAAAEKRAADEKRKAEAQPRSWWDKVKGFIGDVIDGIKKAVSEIFKAARWLVKQIIEGAKALARAAIELARLAVVGLLRTYGLVLKGLVSVALIAFPQAAERARKWIDSKVDSAVEAVHAAAAWLKKKYDELYDWLGRIIDTALSAMQAVLTLGLEILRLLATGQIRKLIEMISTLARAAWDGLGMVEGEIYRELVGFDLTKDLGPQLLAGEASDGDSDTETERDGGDAANIGFLLQDRIRDDQFEVEPVPELEPEDELPEDLDLGDGERRSLDLSNDPERGADAAIQELLEPLAEPDGDPAMKVGASSASSDPLDKEAAEFDSEMSVILLRAKDAHTRGERVAVVRDLLWAGIKKTWHDTPWWKIAVGAVAAVVGVIVLVVLEYLTGGAVTAALPVIMEALAGAFLAAELARMSGHFVRYLEYGMAGEREAAARSFAKGLAVGIVAILMLLLFEAVGKALKLASKFFARAARATLQAGRAVGKAVVTGVRAGVRALVKGVLYIGKLIVRAVKIVARIVARGGQYVLEKGKLIFRGLENTFAKEIKTVARFFERVKLFFKRFKGFEIEFVKNWVLIYAIINSRTLIARFWTPNFDTRQNARMLRDNMEASGVKFRSGQAAHHIVPSTHSRADQARRILLRLGIDINSAANGVPLGRSLHKGLHTDFYIDTVTSLLSGAKNKNQALEILKDIAEACKARRFPH
jgi:hypothetical protein